MASSVAPGAADRLANADADQLADAAVDRVSEWVDRSASTARSAQTRQSEQLARLVADPRAIAFTMRFVDRVTRPESDAAAAHQLSVLTEDHPIPRFLGRIDRTLLRIAGLLAPYAPGWVVPAARRRMRALVAHLVADPAPAALRAHLARERDRGFAINVNLLGEAVLGDAEATRRFERTLALIRDPAVDYVSVKISAISSHINLWAYDETLAQVGVRLRQLYDAAAEPPSTFVNLDMEEYGDLDLTLDLFTQLLDERPELSAGVVLQAYLPDTFSALLRLTQWSIARHQGGGAPVKVRLVKGANLAMERVVAEMHGWVQAPYATKHETDANYKRCLDWVLRADRLQGLHIGVASHNLFDVAWAHELSLARGVADHLSFEMLQGMSPTSAAVTLRATGNMLLYTPVVARDDFDVAISYLFRRLEENAAQDNFLRALFALRPGSPEFHAEEKRFRDALAARYEVVEQPRRWTPRIRPDGDPTTFTNEPDSDPALPETRLWARALAATPPRTLKTPLISDVEEVSRRLSQARDSSAFWRARSAEQRAEVLRRIAVLLNERRGELIATMMHEASKTLPEADAEVSEAVDFARYYADQTVALDPSAFTPLGVVAVVPPWNFPLAIPAGGVFAALAAGNVAVLKPAPETPACAEQFAEISWEGGVPRDVLVVLRTPDNDAGRRIIEDADAVILTGSWETAQLFRSWKPELRLFAETSGKNAMVVTPHADLDQAAHDLVRSAFGHAGQKCSAASLGILVGDVFQSSRFRRQLRDATESLIVGPATDLATELPPLIRPPEGALQRALTDETFRWLVKPRPSATDPRLWSPGIVDAVAPGSWFHRTECFGPLLGLMAADDLDHALELQNATPFGLTGGIQSLDPHEVDHWLARVEVGNAYVNREITGAIVGRQPFGGWKRSSVGPGAKAGGPNYVSQFGTFREAEIPAERETPSEEILDLQRALVRDMSAPDSAWLQAAAEHDAYWWAREYGREHDPAALRVEANLFRYRPHPNTAVRIEADASLRDAARTLLAAHRAGAGLDLSAAPGLAWGSNGRLGFQEESVDELIDRLSASARLRVVGTLSPDSRRRALAHEIEVLDGSVSGSARLELPLYLREQVVSRTLHRYGNLLSEAAAKRPLRA